MNDRDIDSRYDLTAMVARPLYFGMGVNIIAPAAILFICYYFSENYYMANRIPELANTVFYVFAGLALAEAGLALWWRSSLLKQPMICKPETAEKDILMEFQRRLKTVFLLIASVNMWGFIYFFLTGRFREALAFVIFSFVVFQVVRPRHGSVRKVVTFQEELMAQGKFRKSDLVE